MWQQQDEQAEKRHAEVIAAILTTVDGESKTLTVSPFPAGTFERPSTLQSIQAYSLRDECNSDDSQALHGQTYPTSTIGSITNSILDGLHFREIVDRQESVSRAHARTLDWAYDDSRSQDGGWDSLSHWLKYGAGCYWVNGKAGSGKSTFMKYIQEDHRTRKMLKIWAGSMQLITASFFFWYAGTPLQKSQDGLLRSLLFDVLKQRPDLVPTLFPNVYRAIYSGQLRSPLQFSHSELIKAFMALSSLDDKDLRLCFIIDGLDEYAGDCVELTDLFTRLTSSSEHIKILLSSRPIPSCTYAFSACSSLQLQKLTCKDVRLYALEKLGKHPLMQRMEAFEAGSTELLVSGITAKASGVFLWVVLVVRMLIHGLMNYDAFADLQQKLQILPSDLEKLYDHMLGSMSSSNRVEGSRLLQLTLRSFEIHDQYPMTLLQLSFAAEGSPNAHKTAITLKPSSIPEQKESWMCEVTEGRMRSRCCGLIEVQALPNYPKSRHLITFLHRTVVEFLRLDHVWTQLVSLTEGSDFDVDLAMLSSCLSEMKSKPPGADSKDSQAFHCLLRMVNYRKHLPKSAARSYEKYYIPEMVATMSLYWSSGEKKGSTFAHLPYPYSFLTTAAYHLPSLNFSPLLDAIYALNSSSCINLRACLLYYYVDERNIQIRDQLIENFMARSPIMDEQISLPGPMKKLWDSRWEFALAKSKDHSWTIWEFTLLCAFDLLQTPVKDFKRLARAGWMDSLLSLIDSLIKSGASISHTCYRCLKRSHRSEW